jgi:hypothetical protein
MHWGTSPFDKTPSHIRQRWQRCKKLPPLQVGEAKELVAAFLAGHSVTTCPVRYAAAVEQQTQHSHRERV